MLQSWLGLPMPWHSHSTVLGSGIKKVLSVLGVQPNSTWLLLHCALLGQA